MINITEDKMDNELIAWISDHVHMRIQDVQGIISEGSVYRFLLVWTIMERIVFDRDCTLNAIKTKADTLCDRYDELDSNNTFDYFFNRYFNEQNRNNLLHSEHSREAKARINKIFEKTAYSTDKMVISNKEKIYALIYIAFRFRNNLFHGNKEFEFWLKNKTEIQLCTSFLMTLTNVCSQHSKRSGMK